MVFLFDEQYLALAGDTLSLERKVKEKDERIEKLEAENMQLRQFCEEFNALSVAKENQKLKELLIDFVKRMEHYKEVKPDVGFIMFDLGYLANQVKEVLK